MRSVEHMLSAPLSGSYDRYIAVLVMPTDEMIFAGSNETSLVTKTIEGMEIHQCA